MSYKKFGLRVAAVFLAFMITAVSPAAFADVKVRADEISDLEKQQAELNKKINGYKNSISNSQNDLKAKQEYLDTLKDKINNAQSQIDLYDNQVEKIDEEINKLEKNIVQKEKEISNKEAENAERFQQLRQRLQAISKSGNMSKLQMIMDTDSYTDYLIKSKMMERVAENDKKLMDEIESDIKKINEEKASVEAQKQDQSNKRADAQTKKSSSTALKSQLEKDYSTRNAIAKQLQQSIADDSAKKKADEEQNRTIEKLIKDKKAAQAAQGNQNAGGSTGGSSNYKYGGGTMIWPVPAVHNVSSGFGMRWGRMHRGIDISEGEVPVYGQSIVAAADGVVIYANSTNSWGGGYGYHVIIDHGTDSRGNSIVTVYAHCKNVLVSAGQQVKGGQTIAKAGATGDVTGPHLHFEVRVNGTAVDPIKNGYIKAN